MVFTTNNFIVTNGNPDLHPSFMRIEDVPGYDEFKDYPEVSRFISDNLNNKSVCIQASTHLSAQPVVIGEDKKILAAHGWHVSQLLGQGKDGTTFLGYRYDDEYQETKTVKLLSSYAKEYRNHAEIFSAMTKQMKNKHAALFELTIDQHYTYYNNSTKLKQVDSEQFEQTLVEICNLNRWTIKNTGFVFWDLGFGSGRNYMADDDDQLKWVDYGGAGLVRCPNFETLYSKFNDMPALELLEPKKGKDNLVEANSDFVMCQFLLHYEYWKDSKNSTADVWASLIQIKKQILPEMVDVLPRLLYNELSRSIFNEFKDQDWTEHTTWKRLGKYIDEYT